MSALVPVGNVISLEYGKSLPANSRLAGDVPVYGSNGQTGWHNEALIEGPSLIVGRKGSIGQVHYHNGPSFPIDTTYYVKPRPGVDLDFKFAYYMLREARLTELNSATGVPGLNREHAYRVVTRFAALEEQRRIAGLLDRAAEIRRRADAARAKARAIIPALFLDMFGDPATNPKGWPIQPLIELADIGSGLTKGRKLTGIATLPTPYLRVANVQADRLDLSEIKLIDATADDRLRCRLEVGDLLMTEGGDIDKLGRCAMWRGEVDLCLHQNHVFRVRMSEAINSDYARVFMQCEAARSYFLRVAKRTTGIASINKAQLGRLPVWIPPLPRQSAFAEQVQRLETTARALDIAAAKAEAMATALSAEVFDTSAREVSGDAA